MPKSATSTPCGSSRSRRRLATAPPKPSSRRQGLPTAATRISLRWGAPRVVRCRGELDLAREEEVEAARLAHQLLPWVVVDRDPEMDPVVVVDVDPLERRRPAVEHPVVGVDPAGEPEDEPVAEPEGRVRRSSPRARSPASLARPRRHGRLVGRPHQAVQPDDVLGRRGERRARPSPARPGPPPRSPRAPRPRARARGAGAPPRSRSRRRGSRGSRARAGGDRAARSRRRGSRCRREPRARARC